MRFYCTMFWLTFMVITGIAPCAEADAGVFTGNGQDLHQITSKTIQLVSIEVAIVLGRGPFLFDGTVPGMDRAEYQCIFVLRNLSDKDEDVEIGFPIDSEFARGAKPISPTESQNWVLEYGFIARDPDTTYHVDFVRRDAKPGPGEFSSVFVWKMHFSPTQQRTLTVQYRIPMSMGLVPLQKDQTAPPSSGIFGQEFLSMGQLDMAGYITSTGSSWAGNVENAKFILVTEPFEKYFERRGILEDILTKPGSEEYESFNSSFPVHHPWWFRRIKPEGWTPIKGGVQWEYRDYKPQDPIEVNYYTTPFPRLPEEVDPFVDTFEKALDSKDSVRPQLALLKEMVLAVYGCEPKDPSVKSFVSQQLWYEPRKECSAEQFSKAQKSVVTRIDQRIAAAQK